MLACGPGMYPGRGRLYLWVLRGCELFPPPGLLNGVGRGRVEDIEKGTYIQAYVAW